ncbi:MAG: protein-export chaperone SecB [Bacteroidales bacterium]|nr:protein-export chaperone SecB [Bacteroidales bacterium]
MADDKKDDIVMTKYVIDDVSFKLTNSDATAGGKLRFENVFSKRITKVSNDEFEYDLICTLHDEEDKKLPYMFSATIKGWFKLENWESNEEELNREVLPATILFSLLRAYAVTITSNANIMPPLFLGLVKAENWKNLKSV